MSRRVAVMTVLVMAAAACGASPPEQLPPLEGAPEVTTADAAPSTAITSDPEPELDPDDPVELLDAGAEPRREIRIDPGPPGRTERITTRVDASQRMQFSSGWEDISLPVFELDQAITVREAAGTRITLVQAPYAYRIVDERELDAAYLAEYHRVFDLLLELTSTTVVIDDRGRVIEQTMVGEAAEYDLPSFENLATTTSELSVPLPCEPVGLGARWRVETDSVVSGMRMLGITEFELIELGPDRAVARFDHVVTLPRSFIEGSMQRDEVLDGELRSAGSVTWLTGGTLPLVDQETTGLITIRVFRGGSGYRSSIDQRVRTTMSIRD